MTAGIEGVVEGRSREDVIAGDLLDFETVVVPKGGGGAKAEGVEADAGSGTSGAGAAIAEVQGYGAIGVAGLHPDGGAQTAALVGQLHHLPVYADAARVVGGGQAEVMRGARADEDGVIPCEFGDGAGKFLQPAVVGEAAVVDRGVGPEDHFELAG